MKKLLVIFIISCLFLASCTHGGSNESTAETGSHDVSEESSGVENKEKLQVMIGKTTYDIAAYNPAEPTDGITVFDKDSGLVVSEAREGYTDLLVFDSFIADIVSGKDCFMPFPNGYLVRVPDSVAAGVKVGECVSTFGFKVNTNPKEYVLLKDKLKIPFFYRNERRGGGVMAVLYDGDYIHDSTDTNIWGMEVAVDADGKICEISPLGVEGTSGNTSIPEGGFVISSGYKTFCTMMELAHIGDKAEVKKEFGLYDFHTFGLSEGGEGITVVTEGFTKLDQKALEISVTSDGLVVNKKVGGGTQVPKGGFVIVGTGYGREILERFCFNGDKAFYANTAVYILNTAERSISDYKELLSSIKKSAENAKKMLYTVDFKAVDEQLAKADKALEDRDYELLAECIATLQQTVTPSFAVQERGAWVTDYDRDAADIKKTVAYAKSIGLNTLFISPYRDTYALYDTKVPHLERLPGDDLDYLKVYVDECHAAGITCVFDICTFSTVKPSGDYSSEHYVNYFGDKLLISKQGRDVAYFYSDASYTLNPFDPEVRKFYYDIIKEVCDNYDIDGVQLDYIRFPLPSFFGEDRYEDFGYNENIMQAFMKKEGTSVRPVDMKPNSGEVWDRWCQFRCDIITSFIAELKGVIGDMPLTCTCFASKEDRQKYVFQDVASWTDYVDAIYPMIYAVSLDDQKKYGDELYDILGESTRIILGIGTYDGETDEVVTAQHLYSTEFADGDAIFALNYTQIYGFDKTYKRIFAASPAVRTDLEGVTASAYFVWMADTAELTYEYLYKADLGELKAYLKKASEDVKSLEGDALKKFVSDASGNITALSASLDDSVKADISAKLDYLQKILAR